MIRLRGLMLPVNRSVAMEAVRMVQCAGYEPTERFVDELVALLTPGADVFCASVELYGVSGQDFVLCILNASPAHIVRAVILALKE